MADFISAQIILRGSVFLPPLYPIPRRVSPAPSHLPIRGFGVINAAGWGRDEESESEPVTSSAASVYEHRSIDSLFRDLIERTLKMRNIVTRFLTKLTYDRFLYRNK